MALPVQELNKRNLWDTGYADVYKTVTKYSPYKKHMLRLFHELDPKPGEYVIDLGCGMGDLLKLCVDKGCHATGIDYSDTMLEQARVLLGKGIKYINHDLSKPMPFFEKGLFDGVVSNNVLGFLDNPEVFISEALRILKPGGKIVLSTMKKGFDPSAVFKEHVKTTGFLGSLKVIIPTFKVGFYNFLVSNRIKKGEAGNIRGYEASDLETLLKKESFDEAFYLKSYSGQCIVFKGVKRADVST